MQPILVWLAQNPGIWILALGVACSLAYTYLDRFPAARAVFRVVAAALPGDITAIRRAVLLLLEQRLAAKAGVDPVEFAARRRGAMRQAGEPRIEVPLRTPPPDAAASYPPVESTPAQFPPHWDDPDEAVRRKP